MSSFAPPAVRPRAAALDFRKHVNYTLGMVLGVDDFTQEFAYLSGRDQLLARGLLGYGTACGLQVTIEPRDDASERLNNPSIMVAPGLAVTPRGQIVSVTPAQCAHLVDWLAANRASVAERISNGDLLLYLVLCYRECATDMVPIPGEPCRSEDEAMAASRIADDFRLELRFAAPDQREEDALRDFVDWLGQIAIAEVSDVGSNSTPGAEFTPLSEFEDAIRLAAEALGSPPLSPPDFMLGMPPSSLVIPADESCEYLRAAFRIWTTELRPRWLGIGATSAGTPPDEECVLLAELTVPLTDGALNGDVLIDEARRPYLLHLRMLQEWLLCGRHEVEPSDLVTPATEFDLEPDPGVSERYSRADHTHGSPALGGDVQGQTGATMVVGLRETPIVYDDDGPQPGQVLTFVAESEGGSWQPADLPDTGGGPSAPLDGDVTGPSNGNTIRRLQSFSVEATEPEPGQVLTFVSDESERGTWRPVTPSDGGGIDILDGDVTGSPTDNTISRLQRIGVNAGSPQPNQVLTFVGFGDNEGGEWQAVDPQNGIAQLDGDVIGSPTDNAISRLQRTPIEVSEPQPGQVLTFQLNDNQQGRWIAADVPRGDSTAGDFVEHPPNIGPYAIVAAGVVRGSGNRRANVYNGLVARTIDNGRVMVTFDDYKMPDTVMYIVKALAVFDQRLRDAFNGLAPVVMFERFEPEGFVLFITLTNGEPIPADRLGRLELMIEVSQFAVRGR